MTRVLVTGAGGFIGRHLVTALKEKGYWVRGVDLKHPAFGLTDADEFKLLDLRRWDACRQATSGIDEVYALAADTGATSAPPAQILRDNLLIAAHTLEAARLNGIGRYFYPSSASVYPAPLPAEATAVLLGEEEAYPAQPQDVYGWGQLTAERLAHHYREDYGMETRTLRFGTVFGPRSAWNNGRETAPVAACRKVALAKLTGDPVVEIPGDGEQVHAFCYIDDCVEGIYRLMQSGYAHPLNLGQGRLVSANELVDLVAEAAGTTVMKRHVPGPGVVPEQCTDNERLREVLGWVPQVCLEEGLERTYRWVEGQVRTKLLRQGVHSGDGALLQPVLAA